MSSTDPLPFGALLCQFRARAQLSQQALAEQVGVHRHTIRAWEQGDSLPRSRPTIEALAEALWLSAAETEALLRAGSFPQMEGPAPQRAEAPRAPLPRYWQVPLPRNPAFTGREALLAHLRHTLLLPAQARPTVLALCGLGGIGKTQLALEYAYRSRIAYRAVLWAGAETRATLVSAVLAFATTLGLPEREVHDQQRVLKAVKRWLRLHAGWLVILDNLHDLALLGEVLPPEHVGQVVLTTQLQATGGTVRTVVVEPLTAEEGALLLLRRAKLVPPAGDLAQTAPHERATAEHIADLLGGLPLALDQAGAYLEETGCGLGGYLALFQRHQAALLARRGAEASAHLESVTTTFALAFAQVEQASPAAADLLRLCVYLAPEAIPEDLFTVGGADLPASLQPLAPDDLHWQETCAVALRYSLLARQGAEQTLSLHRLVQGVLRATQEEATQRQWAQCVVRLVNRAFPQQVDYANWEICQRLLPHALHCADLIEQWNCTFPAATQLLSKAGRYLLVRAAYPQAQSLLERALALREQALGSTHPDVAESLNQLGELYHFQGQYPQAQALLEQALVLREQALGPTHPAIAESLGNLAENLYLQGRYDQARHFAERARAVFESGDGPTHPDLAIVLGNLAQINRQQGKYDQAQDLAERALAIHEQVLGPDHFYVANSLNNLATIYRQQGRYAQAQPLLERALGIFQQALGPANPNVAVSLGGLGELYRQQGRDAQAQPLLERALEIFQQALGSAHPSVGIAMNYLAELYWDQGQYELALAFARRALAIAKQALGPEHPGVAESLHTLATIYRDQGLDAQAEPLFERALAIRQQRLPQQHPGTALTLHEFAALRAVQGHLQEAVSLYQRALVIREQVYGPDHIKTTDTRARLRALWQELVTDKAATTAEAAPQEPAPPKGEGAVQHRRVSTDPSGVRASPRSLQPRLVTFTCAQCGRSVTELRAPGPRPSYCSASCEQEARRAQTRQRVQRWRARRESGSGAGQASMGERAGPGERADTPGNANVPGERSER